ncbi:MAG: aspartate aminotransferase family protein [Verrucomicrobiota bacterium]
MLPDLITDIPGPESRRLAKELQRYESRNLTYVSEGFPVFWERAEGANVWDVDGNRFLDLNGGFGVATAGYGARHLVETFQQQAQSLYHGMGDVHPSRLKVELCRALSQVTFERWTGQPGKSILGCAGFEAVEAALKTARIHSGKAGVLAFRNGYHGLGYGAMAATGMETFRQPFLDQLRDFVTFTHYPAAADIGCESEFTAAITSALQQSDAGAILVEPIQGRGGEIIPPDWFLPLLRRLADEYGATLIFDEIYSGFFRSGKWFACDHIGVVPDLICVGKGLSGSYPISACIGRMEIMDSWPESQGEALHTSTFLGNPMGCALALSSLRFWTADNWQEKIGIMSAEWEKALSELETLDAVHGLRGIGLLFGLELNGAGAAVELIEPALQEGLILLPAGQEGKVLSIKPSLEHTPEEVILVAAVLKRLIGKMAV